MHSSLMEFIGSFAIAFFGSFARTNYKNDSNPTMMGLSYFFIYSTLTYVFFKKSGGQFNPMLTFFLLISKNTNFVKGMGNLCGQAIGSIIGALASFLIFKSLDLNADKIMSFPAMSEQNKYTDMVIEGFGVYLICLVYFCCFVNIKGPKFISGIVMGGVYLCLKICFYNESGAAFNFVEILGPSLMNGSLGDWLYYFFGHLFGGGFALATYLLFLRDRGQAIDEYETEESKTETAEIEESEKEADTFGVRKRRTIID